MQQFPFGMWPSDFTKGTGFQAGGSSADAPGTEPGSTATAGGVLVGEREQCAALLVRAHDWLERAVAQAPDVNGLVPLVTQAVNLYRQGEYQPCLRLATGVRQAILLARTAIPNLPAW